METHHAGTTRQPTPSQADTIAVALSCGEICLMRHDDDHWTFSVRVPHFSTMLHLTLPDVLDFADLLARHLELVPTEASRALLRPSEEEDKG